MPKSVSVDMRIWFNEKTRRIHLAAAMQDFISTVSADPASKRYHPNLYRKLASVLRKAGAPAPEAEASDTEKP